MTPAQELGIELPIKKPVVFQGSQGSFSEQAAKKFFGYDVHLQAYPNFIQAFTSIEKKKALYAVLPLENTLIGTVYESFDNFLVFPKIQVISDLSLRIVHSLIGLPGTKLRDIQRVYSQLPGLGQCQRFLSKYSHWSIIPFKDTAEAARHVAQENSVHNAAIASEESASIYKLTVLKKGIETNHHNYTRFVVVTHIDNQEFKHLQKQKNQFNTGFVIFSTKDKAGALLHCLDVFAQKNINLHKIESRPIIGKPWEYQFVAELDFNVSTDVLQETMRQLKKFAGFFHVIGFFKRSEKLKVKKT